MNLIVRAGLAAGVLGSSVVLLQPAIAQQAVDLINSKIDFAYIPPKSLKYLPTVDRLKQFRFLEQLTQFLSPLRLPHRFLMVTEECGFVNAYYQRAVFSDVPDWRIVLCYEFVEAVERVAPKLGQSSEFSYEDIVVGGLVGVILHELGHAMFDMLDVPVIGREEDAADQMSTFIALQFSKDVARTIVLGNAYLYKVWFAFGAPAFFDEHGTGLQRYYNSLCLAYGGQPDLFKDLVDKGELPKTRAANCAREYQQAVLAFQKTVLPFVERDLMKKVQERTWLKLTDRQLTLLRQQQQKQKQTFSLAFCNRSAFADVRVALMAKMPEEPQRWQVSGWFPVPKSGCNLIGTFLGDRAYFYGEGNNGTVAWRAPDTDRDAPKQCIDRTNAFQRDAGGKCDSDQGVVRFIRLDVDPSSSGVTHHLTGGK
jgi:hypothetical protein